MGASPSKATKPRSSLTSLCEKATTLSIAAVRVEPLINGYKSNTHGSQKYKSSKKSDRRDTVKINISKPSEFIHLNHAGVDYESVDLIFIPIKQAQIIHIATANMNYTIDHSYRSTGQQMNDDTIKSSRIFKRKLCRKATNRHSNYDAIFSNELFSISHNSNIGPGSKIGVAY